MKNPLLGLSPKEEEEGREKKTASGFQNHHLGPKIKETELRLGFSSNGFDEVGNHVKSHQVVSRNKSGESVFVLKQKKSGGIGAKRWFSETEDGFGDSWKEDQNNHQRAVGPAPVLRTLPVVGWPPVRTFRKNLAPQPKPEMEIEATLASAEASLYVKVNIEGYAVGRKVNLKAHNSYESLSRSLRKMLNNFFSINYFKNQEQNEEDVELTPDHVLIYEDNEGDRMLVGDVPWEMFISTVKRLYIISGSKATALVAGRVAKNQQ